MNVLVVLLPLGLGLLAIAIGAFVWAVRTGQLENLDQEGMRILFEDDDRERRPPSEPSRPERPPPTRGPTSPGEAP